MKANFRNLVHLFFYPQQKKIIISSSIVIKNIIFVLILRELEKNIPKLCRALIRAAFLLSGGDIYSYVFVKML